MHGRAVLTKHTYTHAQKEKQPGAALERVEWRVFWFGGRETLLFLVAYM